MSDHRALRRPASAATCVAFSTAVALGTLLLAAGSCSKPEIVVYSRLLDGEWSATGPCASGRVAIGHEIRDGLTLREGNLIRFTGVSVPRRGVLRLAAGFPENSGWSRRDTLVLWIAWNDTGNVQELRALACTDREWTVTDVDLTPHEREHGDLLLGFHAPVGVEMGRQSERARRIVVGNPTILAAEGAEQSRLNLLLIAIDTLRPDHLGCYGYERPTSPRIDALAEEGTLFLNAFSHSSWTLPSFASTMTSQYASTQGAVTEYGRVNPEAATLARVFRQAGFLTAGIVSNPYLHPLFGMDQGFEQYRFGLAGARDVTESASAWLRRYGSVPFCLFVHYNDPHLPYDADPEVAQFYHAEKDSRVAPGFNDLAGARAGVYSREERGQLMDLYDDEIAYTDRWVGALLDTLGSLRLAGRTLVVLMSDHGEEFWEHGGFEHRHTLFDELLHVPLLFRLPGVVPTGLRVAGTVRAVDVAPTIASVLGVAPHGDWVGVPLLCDGEVRPTPGEVFAELVGVAASLRVGNHKLIVPMRPHRPMLLYDLRNDPRETHNLSKHLIARTRELARQIKGHVAATPTRLYAMLGGEAQRTYKILLETTGQFRTVAGCRLEGEDNLHVSDSMRRILVSGELGCHSEGVSFDVTPADASIRCDAWIDGEEAAPDLVRVGGNRESPSTLPVTVKASDERLLAAAQYGPWDFHYERLALYLWKSNYTGAEGGVLNRLDELTVRQLRSLGYVR